MRTFALPATAALLLAVGCQSKDDKPAAPAHQVDPAIPPADSTPEAKARRAVSQPSKAASQPHGAVGASTPPGAPFTGLVKLAEGVPAEAVKPTDVLFIMARESQGGGLAGRLVAVQRHGKTAYPMRYELGAKDVMVPGIPFQGPFIVTARLDRDGDPMTRGEDDLYATFSQPVKPGNEAVHLVLKKGAPKMMKAPPGVRAPGAPAGASSQPAGAASQPAGAAPNKPSSQPAR